MGELDRDELSLRNAADPDVDELVHVSTAAVGALLVHGRHVDDRAHGPLADLSPSAFFAYAARRMRADDPPAGGNRRDGQLWLFQPSHVGPVPRCARRANA